jgi:hypothetical protein
LAHHARQGRRSPRSPGIRQRLDRDDPNIITEFDDVKQTVIEMSKGSYRSLFEMTEYREFHRVILAYVNQMYQQISGINLITYDTPLKDL